MIRSLVSSAVAGFAAYGVTRAVLGSRLRHHDKVVRTNHAGNDVSLIEGPAVAAGLVSAAVLIDDPRQRAATVLATSVSGMLGGVDDFFESGSSKGLKGHLGALARGEITTGAIKVTGIPLAAMAAAAILASGRRSASGTAVGSRTALGTIVDVVVTGGVIAGSANLFNLLDLRPGRALKAGLITLVALPQSPRRTFVPTAAVIGTTAAAWPDDLGGDIMLGDTGANALGALLGCAFVAHSDLGSRAIVLAGLAGLTLASEKVSFTKIIESTPILAEIDAFGRVTR